MDAERERRTAQRENLRAQGVPERALRAVFDAEPVETRALRDLRAAFAQVPAPVLVVLSGGTGCGKTCAATWWAAQHGATWITAPQLQALGQFGDTRLETVTRSKYLVVDDLGTEYADGKGYFAARIDALVNQRYADVLPTVFTTNVPGKDEAGKRVFAERYGARVVSRMLEAGVFKGVGGPDLRATR
jgi:DNA replication protein DnaC